MLKWIVILSVTIPTIPDRIEHLKRSLFSIIEQLSNFKSLTEILIFCDGDPTKTTIAIKTLMKQFNYPNIRLFIPNVIPKTKKTNHSATRRNFLINQAKGKYFLTCEPEMVFEKNSLKSFFKSIHNLPRYPWFCGPVFASRSVVNSLGNLTCDRGLIEENIPLLIGPLPKNNIDTNYYKKIGLYYEINHKKWPQFYWATILSTAGVKKAGLLNDSLVVRAWEETDLYQRYQKIGGQIIFDKRFTSYHLAHPQVMPPDLRFSWHVFNSTLPFNKNQQLSLNLASNVTEITI